MKRVESSLWSVVASLVLIASGCAGPNSKPPKMKMTTDIPDSITTPDVVKTRIGTLEFFDGFPTESTAQRCFDNLDFLRGVDRVPVGSSP